MDLQRWIDEWVTLETEDQKADFDKRFKEWAHSIPQDQRVSFEEMVYQSAISEVENAENIIEVANIRKVLEPIINYISLSEIAVRDFGKTRQWLYQRLNGSIVNGKPAKFTPEELSNLSFTLEEIAENIKQVAQSIRRL